LALGRISGLLLKPFQKFPEFQWAHSAIQPMRRFKPGLKFAGCSRLISDANKKEQAV
jgi:hypothetical protein